MIINNESLKEIAEGFSKVFNEALSTVQTDYEKIATTVKSSSISLNYAWLSDTPLMREWIGDRTLSNLKAHTYQITKKNWETTIEVDRDDIIYDNLGVVKPRIANMAHEALTHYDELVMPLMEDNGVCFDGLSFFHEEHAIGDDTMSNLGTAPLTQDSLFAARSSMQSLLSESGRPLRIKPNLLVIPSELEVTAIKLLKADFDENGATNISKGLVDYVINPYLTSATAWYLMDTTRPLKPFILQVNKSPEFTAMTNSDDEANFMRRSYRYGVDCEDNAGYGLWQLAYKSTGIEE